MYEKHESYGVLKLSKQALKKESDMINQSKETNAALLQRHYLQAAGLFHAQNQQYAQICSAVQQQSIKDYHQLQYLAERQRHQELEQIKTKERNQESANASRAVKQRLQEVIMARQLKPSNQSDPTAQPNNWHTGSAEFPLRKTVSEPNLKLRSRLKQKQERRNSPLMTRKTAHSPCSDMLNERIRRKLSSTSTPESIQEAPQPTAPGANVATAGPSSSSLDALKPLIHSNSMFSSPSLPNIAQAVRNNESIKRKSSSIPNSGEEQAPSLSTQSSHNPLLVQALIANQLGRIQSQSLNRAHSVDSVHQFNNLALMRLMSKEAKQHSLHLNQTPPPFTLAPPFDMMLKQEHQQRSFDVPMCNRTLIIHDDSTRHEETRLLWETTAAELSCVKFDQLQSRLATRDELKLAHTEKHVASIVDRSPLAAESKNDTIKASRRACAATLEITKSIVSGQAGNGVSLFRPGGAHAERDRALNGAHFNSLAIGARYIRDVAPNTKVLIVSFDQQQAKGLQNVFYSDQNVLNISIYHDTCTSGIEECGRGTGLGHNINIPLPLMANDDDFKVVFDTLVLPIGNEFEPEIVLISAGFDSFYGHVTPECYGWLTKELGNMCDGKLVVAFEGKPYYPASNPLAAYIAASTACMIKSLIYRNETPFMNRQAEPCRGLSERISLVAKTQSKYWTCLQRSTNDTEMASEENLESDLEKMTVISSSQEPVEHKISDETAESMSEDEAIDVD